MLDSVDKRVFKIKVMLETGVILFVLQCGMQRLKSWTTVVTIFKMLAFLVSNITILAFNSQDSNEIYDNKV